jgi:hypothetical protein
MYTIHRADGERDLVLERGLSQLETEFAVLRKSVLTKGEALDPRQHFMICAFIAAIDNRTPARRNHWGNMWNEMRERGESLIARYNAATPEERGRMISLHSGIGSPSRTGFTHDEVKALAANPLQCMLPPLIQCLTPLLLKLDLAIFETKDDLGFITSDNPCVWFDPEACKRPPMSQAASLGSETIEITLPISPTQCLYMNRKGFYGYLSAPLPFVDEINRRTLFEADQFFVVHKEMLKATWFDPGVEPKDSWRNRHPHNETTDEP